MLFIQYKTSRSGQQLINMEAVKTISLCGNTIDFDMLDGTTTGVSYMSNANAHYALGDLMFRMGKVKPSESCIITLLDDDLIDFKKAKTIYGLSKGVKSKDTGVYVNPEEEDETETTDEITD